MNEKFSSKKTEVIDSITPEMQKFVYGTQENLKPYFNPQTKSRWQPSDLIIKDPHAMLEYQELAGKNISKELLVALIGNTVTEEGLPNYMREMMQYQELKSNDFWQEWIQRWIAEEERHGKALYGNLSNTGMVNMRALDETIEQYIISGINIGTSSDPYKLFAYTSFQEMATYVAHKNASKQLKKIEENWIKKYPQKSLSKTCEIIAGDEHKHYKFYSKSLIEILKEDPSGGVLALYEMVKDKFSMPGVSMGEGKLFDMASTIAGTYEVSDYVRIVENLLNKRFEIGAISSSLTDSAKRAQDYLGEWSQNEGKRLDNVAKRIKQNFTKQIGNLEKISWLKTPQNNYFL